jgi:hypothetical protein
MNRFEYEYGDLEFGDSQCSLCVYFNINNRTCELIGNISPKILSDEITCNKFEYEEDL